MNDKQQTTIARVTFRNALRYVDAIVRVAKKGIYRLPIEKRAYVLEMISRYLLRASIHIHHYEEDMIKRGEADKPTLAQRNSVFCTAYDALIED